MKRSLSRIILALTLFSLAMLSLVQAYGQAHHSRKAAHHSGLASLRGLAGKYAVDKVLRNPEVRRQLAQMAGSKAKKFTEYMQVQPPLDMTDGDLVGQGGYPHEVPDKCGVVVISFRENRVYAGLFQDGEMNVYGHGKSGDSLPKGLRDWMANEKSLYMEGPIHVHYH